MSSRMMGFRLDKDNPREAQALMVLGEWQERGYGIRHILTEALIRLGENEASPNTDLADILAALQAISQQIEEWEVRPSHQARPNSEQEANLSEAFLLAVKGAARPGIELER